MSQSNNIICSIIHYLDNEVLPGHGYVVNIDESETMTSAASKFATDVGILWKTTKQNWVYSTPSGFDTNYGSGNYVYIPPVLDATSDSLLVDTNYVNGYIRLSQQSSAPTIKYSYKVYKVIDEFPEEAEQMITPTIAVSFVDASKEGISIKTSTQPNTTIRRRYTIAVDIFARSKYERRDLLDIIDASFSRNTDTVPFLIISDFSEKTPLLGNGDVNPEFDFVDQKLCAYSAEDFMKTSVQTIEINEFKRYHGVITFSITTYGYV